MQSDTMAQYVLCAFRTFCNSWNSFLYTHTVLIVIIGPYTFESRIHKVTVELPNIIEGLVGVQLCTPFLLQICLTDGSVNTTSASGIVPTVRGYYNEIHFSFCILTLTITGLQRFCQPKKSGLRNQTLSSCGWGLGMRLTYPPSLNKSHATREQSWKRGFNWQHDTYSLSYLFRTYSNPQSSHLIGLGRSCDLALVQYRVVRVWLGDIHSQPHPSLDQALCKHGRRLDKTT